MISNDEPVEPRDVEQKLQELANSLYGSSRDIKECLSKQIPTYKPRFTESDDDALEFD